MPRVVIATCNRAGLRRETLDSIVTERPRFEIIVVNDGTTDDTESVVKSYGELLRIRQENRGPSATRNVDIQNARANWISIQDSDDICDKVAADISDIAK